MSLTPEQIVVEDGYPPPPPRKPDGRGNRHPGSPWPAFLEGLKDGQSFKVPRWQVENFKRICKLKGWELRQKREGTVKLSCKVLGNSEAYADRIWIIKNPTESCPTSPP